MNFRIKNLYFTFWLLNTFSEINGLIPQSNLKDNPVLLKTLLSVKTATSDVTANLLSLCSCLREKLNKHKTFKGETNLLLTNDEASKESDIDFYRNIYNSACKNLYPEPNANNSIIMNNNEEPMFNLDLQDNIIKIERDDQNCTYHPRKKEYRLLYDTLIKGLNNHTYKIEKYPLYKHKIALNNKDRRSVIVIITLYSLTNNSILQLNINNVNEDTVNESLSKTSLVDIHIIDSMFTNEYERISTVQKCHLYSLYIFLIESGKKNSIKNFKLLRVKGTLKMYINVLTNLNLQNFPHHCCNKSLLALCENRIYPDRNKFAGIDQIKYTTEKENVENFRSIVSKIKNLINHYNSKFVQNYTTVSVTSEKEINMQNILMLPTDNTNLFEASYTVNERNQTQVNANTLQSSLITNITTSTSNKSDNLLNTHIGQSKEEYIELKIMENIKNSLTVGNNSAEKTLLTTRTYFNLPIIKNENKSKMNTSANLNKITLTSNLENYTTVLPLSLVTPLYKIHKENQTQEDVSTFKKSLTKFVLSDMENKGFNMPNIITERSQVKNIKSKVTKNIQNTLKMGNSPLEKTLLLNQTIHLFNPKNENKTKGNFSITPIQFAISVDLENYTAAVPPSTQSIDIDKKIQALQIFQTESSTLSTASYMKTEQNKGQMKVNKFKPSLTTPSKSTMKNESIIVPNATTVKSQENQTIDLFRKENKTLMPLQPILPLELKNYTTVIPVFTAKDIKLHHVQILQTLTSISSASHKVNEENQRSMETSFKPTTSITTYTKNNNIEVSNTIKGRLQEKKLKPKIWKNIWNNFTLRDSSTETLKKKFMEFFMNKNNYNTSKSLENKTLSSVITTTASSVKNLSKDKEQLSLNKMLRITENHETVPFSSNLTKVAKHKLDEVTSIKPIEIKNTQNNWLNSSSDRTFSEKSIYNFIISPKIDIYNNRATFKSINGNLYLNNKSDSEMTTHFLESQNLSSQTVTESYGFTKSFLNISTKHKESKTKRYFFSLSHTPTVNENYVEETKSNKLIKPATFPTSTRIKSYKTADYLVNAIDSEDDSVQNITSTSTKTFKTETNNRTKLPALKSLSELFIVPTTGNRITISTEPNLYSSRNETYNIIMKQLNSLTHFTTQETISNRLHKHINREKYLHKKYTFTTPEEVTQNHNLYLSLPTVSLLLLTSAAPILTTNKSIVPNKSITMNNHTLSEKSTADLFSDKSIRHIKINHQPKTYTIKPNDNKLTTSIVPVFTAEKVKNILSKATISTSENSFTKHNLNSLQTSVWKLEKHPSINIIKNFKNKDKLTPVTSSKQTSEQSNTSPTTSNKIDEENQRQFNPEMEPALTIFLKNMRSSITVGNKLTSAFTENTLLTNQTIDLSITKDHDKKSISLRTNNKSLSAIKTAQDITTNKPSLQQNLDEVTKANSIQNYSTDYRYTKFQRIIPFSLEKNVNNLEKSHEKDRHLTRTEIKYAAIKNRTKHKLKTETQILSTTPLENIHKVYLSQDILGGDQLVMSNSRVTDIYFHNVLSSSKENKIKHKNSLDIEKLQPSMKSYNKLMLFNTTLDGIETKTKFITEKNYQNTRKQQISARMSVVNTSKNSVRESMANKSTVKYQINKLEDDNSQIIIGNDVTSATTSNSTQMDKDLDTSLNNQVSFSTLGELMHLKNNYQVTAKMIPDNEVEQTKLLKTDILKKISKTSVSMEIVPNRKKSVVTKKIVSKSATSDIPINKTMYTLQKDINFKLESTPIMQEMIPISLITKSFATVYSTYIPIIQTHNKDFHTSFSTTDSKIKAFSSYQLVPKVQQSTFFPNDENSVTLSGDRNSKIHSGSSKHFNDYSEATTKTSIKQNQSVNPFLTPKTQTSISSVTFPDSNITTSVTKMPVIPFTKYMKTVNELSTESYIKRKIKASSTYQHVPKVHQSTFFPDDENSITLSGDQNPKIRSESTKHFNDSLEATTKTSIKQKQSMNPFLIPEMQTSISSVTFRDSDIIASVPKMPNITFTKFMKTLNDLSTESYINRKIKASTTHHHLPKVQQSTFFSNEKNTTHADYQNFNKYSPISKNFKASLENTSTIFDKKLTLNPMLTKNTFFNSLQTVSLKAKTNLSGIPPLYTNVPTVHKNILMSSSFNKISDISTEPITMILSSSPKISGVLYEDKNINISKPFQENNINDSKTNVLLNHKYSFLTDPITSIHNTKSAVIRSYSSTIKTTIKVNSSKNKNTTIKGSSLVEKKNIIGKNTNRSFKQHLNGSTIFFSNISKISIKSTKSLLKSGSLTTIAMHPSKFTALSFKASSKVKSGTSKFSTKTSNNSRVFINPTTDTILGIHKQYFIQPNTTSKLILKLSTPAKPKFRSSSDNDDQNIRISGKYLPKKVQRRLYQHNRGQKYIYIDTAKTNKPNQTKKINETQDLSMTNSKFNVIPENLNANRFTGSIKSPNKNFISYKHNSKTKYETYTEHLLQALNSQGFNETNNISKTETINVRSDYENLQNVSTSKLFLSVPQQKTTKLIPKSSNTNDAKRREYNGTTWIEFDVSTRKLSSKYSYKLSATTVLTPQQTNHSTRTSYSYIDNKRKLNTEQKKSIKKSNITNSHNLLTIMIPATNKNVIHIDTSQKNLNLKKFHQNLNISISTTVLQKPLFTTTTIEENKNTFINQNNKTTKIDKYNSSMYENNQKSNKENTKTFTLTHNILTKSLESTTRFRGKSKTIKYNTYKPMEDDREVTLKPHIISKYKLVKSRQYKFLITPLPRNKFRKTSHILEKKNDIFHHIINERVTNKKESKLPLEIKKTNCRNDENKEIITEKTNLYPLKKFPSKSHRKVIKRIHLPNKDKDIIAMDSKDFFNRRQLTAKPKVSFIQKPPINQRIQNIATVKSKHHIIRPIIDKVDGIITSSRERFKPKPLFFTNSDDFYRKDFMNHHQNDALTLREKVNYIKETFPILNHNLQTKRQYQVIDRPVYLPPIDTKPKILRDRIDYIRSYLYNSKFIKSSKLPVKNDVENTTKDEEPYRDPLYYFRRSGWYEDNFEGVTPTTTTTRKPTKRQRRTIFFLSPTIPYNYYI